MPKDIDPAAERGRVLPPRNPLPILGAAVVLLVGALALPEDTQGSISLLLMFFAMFWAARSIRRQKVEHSAVWWALWVALPLMLSGVIGREVHATLRSTDYPFPSPADAPILLSYLCFIVGALLLVRYRTVRGEKIDTNATMLVAFAVAGGLWATIHGPAILDNAQHTNSARAVLSVYLLLDAGIAAVTYRLAAGPGARNLSFVLFASSMGVLLIADVIATLDSESSLSVGSIVLFLAPVGFLLFAAAMAAPSLVLVAKEHPIEQRSISTVRVLLVGGAALVPVVSLAFSDGTVADFTVRIVLASGAVVFSILHVASFIRASEASRAKMDRVSECISQLLSPDSREQVFAEIAKAAVDVVGSESNSTVVVLSGDGRFQVFAQSGRLAPVVGENLLVSEELRSAMRSRRVGVGCETKFSNGVALSSPRFVAREFCPVSGPSGWILASGSVAFGADTLASLSGLADTAALSLDALGQAEEAHRRRSNQKVQKLMDQASSVVALLSADHVVSFVSSNCGRFFGVDPSDVEGKELSPLFHEGDRAQFDSIIDHAVSGDDRSEERELRVLLPDGQSRWFQLTATDRRSEADIGGIVVTATDIHDRRQSEQRVLRSEARFRSLVQHSSDIVAIIDADEFLTYVSPAIEPILGYKPSELLGSNILDILAIDAVREASDIRDRLVAGESVDRESLDLRTAAKDGSWRYLNVTVTDMLSDPAVAGIVLNVRDDTERLSLERNLRFQANHDSLTSLANRPQLVDALGDVLADGTRQTEMIGVMFIDLDDFKMINDALGHSVGDQVLVEVSNRLATTVRINDVLARFGADEFAVLMTGIYGEHEMLDLAERVLASISKSLPVDGRAINLSASIGIAYDTNRSISADELVKQADVAMYSAKDRGKAQVAVFDEQMLSEAGGRLDLIESLRQGIENHELEVHYQPLVNLQTEHIVGFEALVRWNHPERGLIGPAAFIDVAEDTGLINPLGMLVLDDASRQLADWIENGHDLYMSVNVSAVQLQLDTIVEDLTGCVAAAGLDHGRIVLEITESVFVRDKDLIADRLQKLRANGFRIAIDDFGTGYSSLQYLQQFEFDILKIDKSFVDRLETGDDGGVIETVIGLAAKSNATTVAEGIESAGQARALRELSCELGQGYYYARPMPAAETANALASEPLPLDSTNAEVAQRAA